MQTLLAAADPSAPSRFVVSRPGMNRKGFSIDQNGWNLADFRKNPIALWMHDPTVPIGTWADVKIEGGQLMATLRLAARGTSSFIDTLWSLMEQGILKAASVGFKVLDSNYDEKKDVLTVTKAELREISLVSVPGDAGALKMMETLADAQMRDSLIRSPVRPGGSADNPKPSPKRNENMTLAERIRAKEEKIPMIKDKILALSSQDEMSDADNETLDGLTTELETEEKALASLKRAEGALALSAKSTKPGGVPAQPKKERQKAELLFRAAHIISKAHVSNRSVQEIILADYGGDRELDVMTLAASNPAMTTVQGWAAELIETQIGEFLDLLSPESVWAAIAGLRLTFDRMGAVRLPGRTSRTLGGSFVGEGAPIPVKQAVLSSILVTPFKLGVITTMTRELALRSSPAAEPLFRSMMIEDTAVNIDTVLMDAAAASATRPAGLQVLGTGAASAGVTVANIVADLRAMVQNMITAGAGRRPVWVMNEVQRIGLLTALSTTQDSRPFADEVARGRLFNYPIISSITVPTGLVFLIDQAEFVQGYGDSPAIDMSNQATLHMEDTNPLPIATGAQGSGVLATPTRSLFQTDSLALRLIWDISWAVRRAGAVQFRTGVAW